MRGAAPGTALRQPSVARTIIFPRFSPRSIPKERLHDPVEARDHNLVQGHPAAAQVRHHELVQLLLHVAVVADEEALRLTAVSDSRKSE
ncbi:hypothetical protein A7J05_11220 [Streptomyces alfalfae]|uniref:Uncharacterized protein n=1 Tax=Streptomyces alfalfae TaxID=1642299 RepID=A0ABM6GQR3_9ACTN|nr:hypothetical protein A7J05_11220 [Streptomyces alfalfae]